MSANNVAIFGAAALAVAFNALNSTLVAVALPQLQAEFGASPETLTLWLVNGFLVVTIIGLIPAGKLADILGLWRALRIGQWVFLCGAILAIAAPWLELVIAGRLLMAVGSAILHPTGMALVRNYVSAERRPRAFGALATSNSVAAVIGPALAGIVAEEWGWRAIFAINLPVLAVAWMFARSARRSIGEDDVRIAQSGTFDWLGSLFLAATLVFLIGGLATDGALSLGMLSGWLVMGAVFLWWEQKVGSPVLALRLFRNPTFSMAIAVLAVQFFSMYGILFQMPFMFASLAGFGAGKIGLALMIFSAAVGCCSPVAGRCSERFGASWVIAIGAVVGAIGVFLLGVQSVWASFVSVAMCFVLAGIGYGAALGPSQAAALGTVGSHESGAASAALSTLRYTGGIVGISVLGMLMGDVPSGAAPQTHHLGPWIFGGAFLVSGVIGLGLRDRRRPDRR